MSTGHIIDYGYKTDKGCELCGQKPAWIEPRFGYIFCEKHKDVPPVKFSKETRRDKRSE